MIKKFRVAGYAAASLFLCAGATAAAAENPIASPAVHATAGTPVTQVELNAGAVSADLAVLRTAPAPVAGHSTADTLLTPGRGRPDRLEERPQPFAAPAPAPVPGAAVTRRSLEDLVAQHSGTEVSDAEFECLASAVYFESRGEPLEGQLAVAEVVLNRVRSGRFRSTICDVVTQPSQFSFVRGGRIPEAPRASAAWARAVAIARIAMDDLHDVTGDDSLFFHATYVRPNWGRPRIARIGNHIFYR